MWPLARFRVDDDSMRPTLSPGDYVFVNRWAYLVREPRPGDVVVVRSPEAQKTVLVKRIAQVVDREKVFLIGDNLNRSRDSRHFGPVHRSAIVGRVWVTAKT
ncbi:MAG TPA: nickel-type superoxide dismutase maturation protease [Thermoplasmata archaeon]|jgi:nickel-type superoxide dismutase maturation protease